MRMVIAICVALTLIGAGCPKCVKSHRGIVHHDGWTQIVSTGKMTYPIYHPAYDSEEDICDEYSKE